MKHYLAYWCNEGLESITDITKYSKWDQQQLVNVIAGKKTESNPVNSIISIMRMRAQANFQRHYELYYFTSDIEQEDIEESFKYMPQQIVNMIRKVGVKIFSDRANASNIKIQ